MTTQLQSEIRKWILTAIYMANGPMSEAVLKSSIRGAFSATAFTDADLTEQIKACEASGHIAGTNDDITGLVWDLTSKGKIKARQLS